MLIPYFLRLSKRRLISTTKLGLPLEPLHSKSVSNRYQALWEIPKR